MLETQPESFHTLDFDNGSPNLQIGRKEGLEQALLLTLTPDFQRISGAAEK